MAQHVCKKGQAVVPVTNIQDATANTPHKFENPASPSHYVGNCQNYGPFLGPYYNTGPNTGPNLGDPKRDHNLDNPPCTPFHSQAMCCIAGGSRFSYSRKQVT